MATLGTKPIMLKTAYLSSPINEIVTELVVESLQDIGGVAITSMTPFGTTGYLTLSPRTVNEEVVAFTGITVLGDNKVRFTGISRGMAPTDPWTASSTYAHQHLSGAEVIVSNTPQFYKQFISENGDATITGQFSFTTTPLLNGPVSNSKHATTKEYVDDKAYGAVSQDELIIDNAPATGSITARMVVKFDPVDYTWKVADQDDVGIDAADSLVAFAKTAISAGTIDVILLGTLTGFSGLTPGETYYLGDNGGITTTPTGALIVMGVATAANEMLLADRPVNEKVTAALQGSRGVPSSTNKFVTEMSLGVDKWSAATTYAIDSIVEYAGSIWRSLIGSNLNNTPKQIASLALFDNTVTYPGNSSGGIRATASTFALPGAGADRTGRPGVVMNEGRTLYFIGSETAPAENILVKKVTKVPYRFDLGTDIVTTTTFDLYTILTGQAVTFFGVTKALVIDQTQTHLMLAVDSGANSKKLLHLTMSTPGDVSTVTFQNISGTLFSGGMYGFDVAEDGTKVFYGAENSGRIAFRTMSTPWNASTIGSESLSTIISAGEDIGFAFSRDGRYVYGEYSLSDTFFIRKANAAWDISSFSSTGASATMTTNPYSNAGTGAGRLTWIDETGTMIWDSNPDGSNYILVSYRSADEPIWEGNWRKISK